MKLLPLQLPSSINMERIPLQLPFSPTDLLWRYPLSFPPPQQPPASPLMDFKTQLPTSLATDPRIWSRDDVASFLKWCEREFDLPNFDMEMFQMNGKALCFLTKTDLGERSPGAGDVLHNVLQMLVRDSSFLGRCLPSSPVTPTSRVAYPLSPHSHPPTPNWNVLGQPSADAAFAQASHAANLAHFMNQNNSVTLSPAPSIDSQSGSPQRVDSGNATSYVQTVYGGSNSAGGSGSNQSDSDEESYHAAAGHGSPPTTPGYLLPPACPLPPTPRSPRSPCDRKDLPAALQHQQHQQHQQHPGDGKIYQSFKKEFFPNDMPEPNTNGRLLWDFLQQLLNDPTQRYTNYIAWKNHDTGVFKIVDPAGLAKLWGIQKNHLSMNYDKMSRALRYYYRVNILRKVQGERHCYQFLRNPTELKNIKNISLLRQQMSPTRVAAQPVQAAPLSLAIKTEPDMDVEEHKPHLPPTDEEMPTDLSMPASDSLLRKRPHLDPPKPLTLSDKHRISMIVGENLQKLSREREQHYAALNLSEKSEH